MPPRIAVFTKNRSNPGYEAARIGADRAAKRLGATTVHYVPEQPDNVQEQIALIARAISEKPDAVLFVPVHETAVNGAIVKFDAAGIPLFNFVTRTTAGKRVCFVGSDDRPLAMKLARYLFEKLAGKGEIVIFEGTPASATSGERHSGFLEALKEFPDIKVRASLRGDYLRDVARRVFVEHAAELEGIDAVLSANDYMALGVLDELAARGSSLPLVAGVNAIPEAIAAIEAGRMLATANFDPMAMTSIAVEAAMRYLKGEKIPPEIILPVQIVDASNCAQWNKPFEARPVPTWNDATGQSPGA
jgi:ribose transport system substrate-binding protein